jgi:hypothetical protein
MNVCVVCMGCMNVVVDNLITHPISHPETAVSEHVENGSSSDATFSKLCPGKYVCNVRMYSFTLFFSFSFSLFHFLSSSLPSLSLLSIFLIWRMVCGVRCMVYGVWCIPTHPHVHTTPIPPYIHTSTHPYTHTPIHPYILIHTPTHPHTNTTIHPYTHGAPIHPYNHTS